MFIATHDTSSVLQSSSECLMNVLATTKTTTMSTVWKASVGKNRYSHGPSRWAE